MFHQSLEFTELKKVEKTANFTAAENGVDVSRDIEAPIVFNNRILAEEEILRKAALGKLLVQYSESFLTAYEVNSLMRNYAGKYCKMDRGIRTFTLPGDSFTALEKLSRCKLSKSMGYQMVDILGDKLNSCPEIHQWLPTGDNLRQWIDNIIMAGKLDYIYIDSVDPAWMTLSVLGLLRGGCAIHRLGRDVGNCTLEQIWRFAQSFEEVRLIRSTLGRLFIAGFGFRAKYSRKMSKERTGRILDLFGGFGNGGKHSPDAATLAHSLAAFMRRVNLATESFMAADGIDKSDIWAAIHGFFS